MPWLFEQATGWMSHNGTRLAQGYAGNGRGLNNPTMQNVSDVGPLPVGWYGIGVPYDNPKTGPYTMDLEPNPNNAMAGRFAFRIHGDLIDGPPDSASDGCIIMPRFAREAIWESKDTRLQVIAELPVAPSQI